jgi:hypothetical protein
MRNKRLVAPALLRSWAGLNDLINKIHIHDYFLLLRVHWAGPREAKSGIPKQLYY